MTIDTWTFIILMIFAAPTILISAFLGVSFIIGLISNIIEKIKEKDQNE